MTVIQKFIIIISFNLTSVEYPDFYDKRLLKEVKETVII